MRTSARLALRARATPPSVPPEPTAATKPSILPAVSDQISSAVVVSWMWRLAMLSNWLAQIAPSVSSASRREVWTKWPGFENGAALYSYYAHGELKAEGSSVAEGIGQGRITANLEGAPIDTQFRISDEQGLEWVGRLLKEEGLCLGLSSGINVAGAVALGQQLGKDARVATILADTGFRYLSTLYNAEWLEAKGLPVFDWLR
jgi:hypothetical protein